MYACRPLVLDQTLPDIVEGASMHWVSPGAARIDEGRWTRIHTREDGLVDWSEFCYLPELRHAVAASVLEVDQPEWRELEIASTGPVAVFLAGSLVAHFTDVSYMEPVARKLRVRLGSGLSSLMVATWQVGMREVRHVCRVAVGGLPVRIVIPSPGADEYASRVAEGLLEEVSAHSWALSHPRLALSGPAGVRLRVSTVSGSSQTLLLDGGRGEVELMANSANADDQGSASMLTTGETTLTIKVDDERCPVTREMKVAVLPDKVRTSPLGSDPTVWRREVLEHVASSAPSVARALAKAELFGAAASLVEEDLSESLSMLNQRADCADFEAVGLINLWHVLEGQDMWPGESRDALKQALLGFKYWIDQPGLDAMCYFTENHQLVFHVAELLAGELFPAERFTNTGWLGLEHAQHGASMAWEWIRAKLSGGFSEFDSNAYLAIDSLALVSLVELAAEPEIKSAAEGLLNKLLFTLAANSWHGIHGAAHGRSYAQTLRSSRFEETAPIMWALWGTGALNRAVLPATCLARSRRYELTALIRAVANEHTSAWYGRQVYRGQYSFQRDLLSRPYGSDLRVWKTDAAMLSSVQDYRSGLPGLQEHIWGATLSPEVQVFATYPGSASDSPSSRPNSWAGQRVLPRARQDRDTVLVSYISEGPLPTHVWFPAPLMDEVVESGSWIAGRVGDGFVAVATDGGFEALRRGATAHQEWLARRAGTSFVATVGSAGEDGSFAAFVSSLSEPDFTTASLGYTARDGRRLELSSAGTFSVDGKLADVGPDGRPATDIHLDNPSCTMRFGDDVLVANYAGYDMSIDIKAMVGDGI
jgi:hypothetical protein